MHKRRSAIDARQLPVSAAGRTRGHTLAAVYSSRRARGGLQTKNVARHLRVDAPNQLVVHILNPAAHLQAERGT